MEKNDAEKFFGRKATTDSYLTPKAFINKKVVQPVKNYGRNVVGGAKIVGSAIKNRFKK